jgi:hypothetical protein
MAAPRFFHVPKGMISVALAVLLMLVFVGYQVFEEISMELAYYREFGREWRQHYEIHFGQDSLSHAHVNLAIGMAGIPSVFTLTLLLFREISGRNRLSQNSPRRRKSPARHRA